VKSIKGRKYARRRTEILHVNNNTNIFDLFLVINLSDLFTEPFVGAKVSNESFVCF